MKGSAKGRILTCKVCGFGVTSASALGAHYRQNAPHRPAGAKLGPMARVALEDGGDSYWSCDRGRSIAELDALHAAEMRRLFPLLKKA